MIHTITERKRTKTRETLHRASLEIQESLGLNERLAHLLNTAKTVLELDRVNILLADPERQWLRAVTSMGTIEPLEVIRVPIGPEGGAIAHAYLTKQAIFWDGQGSVPEEFRLKPPYDQIEAFRSRVFANVPLVVQGRAIGVMGADRKHSRRPLEPATRELLQLFAAQAAIAIDNARLYEGVESTNRSLTALNQVAQTVNRFLHLQEILQAALDATLKAVELEAGNIRLWDEREGFLTLWAHRGMSAGYVNRRRHFRPGEGVAGKVFESGEVFLVEDLRDYPDLNTMAQKEGVRSVASIPIRSRDKVVGVMSILSHGERRFTPAEIDLLTAIGNQIGTAIENARLYGEAVSKTERLEGLIRTSTKVTGTLRVEEVLRGIAEEAANLLGVRGAGFRLLEGDRLVVAGVYGVAQHVMLTRSIRVGESLSGLVAQEGRPVMVPNLREDQAFLPEHKKAASAHGILAYLGVPLRYHDRTIGVLMVFGKEERRFQDEDINLLSTFANQAAIAIENARLYEAQRVAALELEATVEARTLELQRTNVELQQALHRAEEASRAKSQFLATMSHELRTPLNPIIGFSELLEDQQFGALNEKQRQYVSRVLTSARHLLSLIDGILDLAKVEAGRLDLEPVSLHLPQALKTSCEGLRPQAAAKGIELQLDLGTCPPTLVADASKIRQILDHLLSNAIKFTPTGGTVTVSACPVQGSGATASRSAERLGPELVAGLTVEASAEPFRVRGEAGPNHEPSTMNHERPADFVEIRVEDTGIGIKAEDVPKLFQPFTQLDASLTRKHQGTGLGLALAKRLVELHGGTIRAESSGAGQGSTFTVTLPLEGPAADQVEPQTHQGGTSALPAA